MPSGFGLGWAPTTLALLHSCCLANCCMCGWYLCICQASFTWGLALHPATGDHPCSFAQLLPGQLLYVWVVPLYMPGELHLGPSPAPSNWAILCLPVFLPVVLLLISISLPNVISSSPPSLSPDSSENPSVLGPGSKMLSPRVLGPGGESSAALSSSVVACFWALAALMHSVCVSNDDLLFLDAFFTVIFTWRNLASDMCSMHISSYSVTHSSHNMGANGAIQYLEGRHEFFCSPSWTGSLQWQKEKDDQLLHKTVLFGN